MTWKQIDPEIIVLQTRLIHPLAKLPFKKRQTDAGYDIHSVEEVDLIPHRASIVRTGIEISAPPGFYYTVEGRSSLWSKGVFPNRGIIDSTYCGELVVSLVNVNDTPYTVKIGDRIAQIILHKQYDADFEVVAEFSAIYNQRGVNGFGSTGCVLMLALMPKDPGTASMEKYIVAYAKIIIDKETGISLQGVYFGGVGDTDGEANNIARECVNTMKGGTILPRVLKVTDTYSIIDALYDAHDRFEAMAERMKDADAILTRNQR